jgi:hypothetical protein
MIGFGGGMDSPKIGDRITLDGKVYVITGYCESGYQIEREGMNWWKRLLVRFCTWLMDAVNAR